MSRWNIPTVIDGYDDGFAAGEASVVCPTGIRLAVADIDNGNIWTPGNWEEWNDPDDPPPNSEISIVVPNARGLLLGLEYTGYIDLFDYRLTFTTGEPSAWVTGSDPAASLYGLEGFPPAPIQLLPQDGRLINGFQMRWSPGGSWLEIGRAHV